MVTMQPPTAPCKSCPYRRDAPSGVWHQDEYAKLPEYDESETLMQPVGMFGCHIHRKRVCAGWAGCHNMNHVLAVRIAVVMRTITEDTHRAILDYVSPVPLFASGRDAYNHGMADYESPGNTAADVIRRLIRRRIWRHRIRRARDIDGQ